MENSINTRLLYTVSNVQLKKSGTVFLYFSQIFIFHPHPFILLIHSSQFFEITSVLGQFDNEKNGHDVTLIRNDHFKQPSYRLLYGLITCKFIYRQIT
jgi:hypothetical protein